MNRHDRDDAISQLAWALLILALALVMFCCPEVR